jgi:hypothetical protein
MLASETTPGTDLGANLVMATSVSPGSSVENASVSGVTRGKP